MLEHRTECSVVGARSLSMVGVSGWCVPMRYAHIPSPPCPLLPVVTRHRHPRDVYGGYDLYEVEKSGDVERGT